MLTRIWDNTHTHTAFQLCRTAKRLAVVVAAFITCWLPFFVSYVARPFHAEHVIPAGVYTFLTWLGNYTYTALQSVLGGKSWL